MNLQYVNVAKCQWCKMTMMQNDNDAKCQLYIYVNCTYMSMLQNVNVFQSQQFIKQFLTLGKELNKFYKFFSFFRAFIASNVDICRSDSWYCLDNSFHDYDHFILCQNASLLLSIGFFKQTQTVRYWKVRFFKRTKKGDMFMQGVSSLSSDVSFFKNCRRLVCKTATL